MFAATYVIFAPYRHGLRNSLLIAPMPTASTAQILGNNESIEPYTSNIYSRRVLSGEFQVCYCSFLYLKMEIGEFDFIFYHIFLVIDFKGRGIIHGSK